MRVFASRDDSSHATFLGCPATAEALAHAATGEPTYQYEFEHAPPGRPVTAHSSELNFLFGFPSTVELSDMDRTISQQTQAYWSNFARTGNPNGEALPVWPRVTVKGREYRGFTDSGAAAKAGLRRGFCEIFIQSLQSQTAK